MTSRLRAQTQDRSYNRSRGILLTASMSAGARAITILTSLVAVPLTLAYLGEERYGLWLTMNALMGMLVFADLGIGNGIVNLVAEAKGQGDLSKAREAVSSGLGLLLGISALLGIAVFCTFGFIPWQDFVNLASPDAKSEFAPALFVFVCFFLVGIPVGITQKLQFGYQEGYRYFAWQAGGSVLGLLGLLAATKLHTDMPSLTAIVLAGPLIAAVANGVHFFWQRYPKLRPSWHYFSPTSARSLLIVGSQFLILQLTMVIAFQADSIVIAHVMGAGAVPSYAIPQKLFTIGPMLLGFVLTPLWPAYREAYTLGDVKWIEVTLKQSIKLGVFTSLIPSLLVFLFADQILHVWTRTGISAPYSLRLGFALFVVLQLFAGSAAALMNALDLVKFQAVSAAIMCVFNILLSIYLTNTFGISGPIWGTNLSLMLFSLFPCYFVIVKRLKYMKYLQLEAQVPKNSVPVV